MRINRLSNKILMIMVGSIILLGMATIIFIKTSMTRILVHELVELWVFLA